MVNATNVAGKLMDRMDNLTKQLAGADAATAQQIQAQITQLGRVFDLVMRVMEQIKQSWQGYTSVR
ncbi:hypothetical protein D3C85_1848990 [compost metagenome]